MVSKHQTRSGAGTTAARISAGALARSGGTPGRSFASPRSARVHADAEALCRPTRAQASVLGEPEMVDLADPQTWRNG
ncbi:hypothetical protein GCM10010149_15920 [Nonomuraea roseoviolacea subsp. roseoviolacea]